MSYVLSAVRDEIEKNHQSWLQEGLKQGRHEGILSVARRLLVEEGMSPQAVQKLTGLPKKEVMDLVDKR